MCWRAVPPAGVRGWLVAGERAFAGGRGAGLRRVAGGGASTAAACATRVHQTLDLMARAGLMPPPRSPSQLCANQMPATTAAGHPCWKVLPSSSLPRSAAAANPCRRCRCRPPPYHCCCYRYYTGAFFDLFKVGAVLVAAGSFNVNSAAFLAGGGGGGQEVCVCGGGG